MVSTDDQWSEKGGSSDSQHQVALAGTAVETSPLAPADVVLKLDHVSKFFGPVQAVKEASLEVHRGEVLTLLGPSGCGKTTTLRMIVGLERVSEGEIIYGGRIVDSATRRQFVPPHKRNMGMVFQSYAIWPHMTVFENVAYPLKIRRVKGREVRERVGHALEQVGLAGYEQRPATMLSGGQQQRVAVARALVFEPDILLMDEPFSNLDAKLREQMRGELRILQRRLGITVLFVTHDQIEALSLSDRIVVMNQGKIEQVGTPVELYRHPATPAVRDFLGRTIMFHGQIVRHEAAGSATVRLQDERGPLVLARHVAEDGLAPGDPCAVAIRPESIHVRPGDGSAGQQANAVAGKVETLLFIGDRYEAAVALPWGQSVVIYLPPSDEWQEGRDIVIDLPAEDVHVWPA